MARYGRLGLLCLDELGYVQLDARGSELLFEILTEREEKASVAGAPGGSAPANLREGCLFANRCPLPFGACFESMLGPTQKHHGGWVRCHLHTKGPVLAGESVASLIATSRDERAP